MAHFDQKGGVLIDNDACRQQLTDNWPVVLDVAARMYGRMRGYWTREELASFGFDGLLDALKKYDPAKGSWLPYAKLRIRGAILDGISISYWHFIRASKEKQLAKVAAPTHPDYVAERDHVRTILASVSPLTRQVLVMYYLCGYDQEKIGRLTGVTGSAVSHRIRRGLRYLRDIHG